MGQYRHHQAVKARVVQFGDTLRKERGPSVLEEGTSSRAGASAVGKGPNSGGWGGSVLGEQY